MNAWPAPAATCCAIAVGALVVSHVTPAAESRPPVDRAVAAACTKDMVLLGELPSHGESKAFQAKAEITKRLIGTCGFSAIVFEAPLYEFELASPSFSGRGPSAVDLDDGIGLLWTTHELADWRAWLAASWSSQRLLIGGMDDQPSATSRLTTRYLPDLVAAAVPDNERERCREVVRRHLEWSYTDETPFDSTEKSALAACARSASRHVLGITAGSPQAAMLRAFGRYAIRQVVEDATPTRDDSMYDALTWHVQAWPRGTRVIVWTATVHAAREGRGLPCSPLGKRLAATYGSQLVSIGFTAMGGTTSMAGAKPSALADAPAGSLERLALGGTRESEFVDHRALTKFDGKSSRLFGHFVSAAWSRNFDGVIVFRTELAPTFPPRTQPH